MLTNAMNVMIEFSSFSLLRDLRERVCGGARAAADGGVTWKRERKLRAGGALKDMAYGKKV